ncbi:MAG: N-acetylmuramoyl-L-alanine amidase [Paludibacter sp.]|jgi:N-acetylmuramoyl-L-alanine amidase|nr:N-acetylmuramoyl-L-alanine amidase [Paludibacter sp.]
MKRIASRNSLQLILFLLMMVAMTGVSVEELNAQKRNFVLVLDAGHGGRDPGAVGKISQEKNITLSVVKKVGSMVEQNMPDVKVVYTRKTDVFVPLEERANIANNHHADMFISVHTNAAKSTSAYGAETYTLGLAKTQANLAVAMAENSVMMLEDDYKTRYQGFDPSSVDSYIMFEFMMDTYLDNSISFATDVQHQLTTNSNRHDRGVRQAGFWVLHRSACPSVLVELGFISNRQEELYMASEKGQQELAQSIYNAFLKYKRNYDRKSGNGSSPAQRNGTPEPSAPSTSSTPPAASTTLPSSSVQHPLATSTLPVYKVQFLSSPTVLKPGSSVFKGVKDASYYQEGGLYKYTVGAETDFNKANQLKNEVRKKFADAFVIAFLEDKKISISEAQKIKP